MAAKKAAAKPIAAAMSEDIIPMLKEALEKETGLAELTLTFQNNQVEGRSLYCYLAAMCGVVG